MIDPAGRTLVVDAGLVVLVVVDVVLVVVVVESRKLLVALGVDALALMKGGALAPLGATPPVKGVGVVGGNGLFVVEFELVSDGRKFDDDTGRGVRVGLTVLTGAGLIVRTWIGRTDWAIGAMIIGARNITGGRPGT